MPTMLDTNKATIVPSTSKTDLDRRPKLLQYVAAEIAFILQLTSPNYLLRGQVFMSRDGLARQV